MAYLIMLAVFVLVIYFGYKKINYMKEDVLIDKTVKDYDTSKRQQKKLKKIIKKTKKQGD